ncbi:MAG: hypothetical protein HQK70_00940 [Desulfamplus sp.]|nr:hypothetical protein [Desulfamplus sp.]
MVWICSPAKALILSVLITLLPGLIVTVQAASIYAASDNPPIASNLPVAVIISREIKPFIEMVEGFESAIDQPVVRIFLDQNSNPFSHDPLYKDTLIDNYSFVIAVGPSALSYIVQNNNWANDKISKNSHTVDNQLLTDDVKLKSNQLSLSIARKVLYAMVLNPETIIPEGVSICGISLNLFSEDTVSKIIQIFPSVRKLGVLFDPENNSEWFKRAKNSGVFRGITTVLPLYIREQADISSLNKQDGSNVDALLFIPDKTVTSPTIISHIIKQSIAKKIPVIGYNSFFHKSGAALSFILDYRLIGEQMAQKVMAISRGDSSQEKFSHRKSCEPSTPAYHITLNRAVVELLELDFGSSLPSELRVEP